MRTRFITGCSSGLGHEIAEAALKRKETVVVSARDINKLKDFKERYSANVLVVKLDLNDRDSMKKAVNKAVSTFGGIDILVNNAGHGYRAAIEESEPEIIKELFDTNFFAPMDLIKMVLPIMRKKGRRVIVNVTSIGAIRGVLGNGYYSATKGALELVTEALDKEVEHLGIQTLLIEPGAFCTNFYGEGLKGTENKISDYDVLAQKYRKENTRNNKNQLGDPTKAGEVIVETILSEEMPKRLLLGSDALQIAQDVWKDRLKESEKWKNISLKTDYDL